MILTMVRHCSVHIKYVNLFNSPTTLWSQHYYPHFTDGKSEVQRNEAIGSGKTGIWTHAVWLQARVFNSCYTVTLKSLLNYSNFKPENRSWGRQRSREVSFFQDSCLCPPPPTTPASCPQPWSFKPSSVFLMTGELEEGNLLSPASAGVHSLPRQALTSRMGKL